MLNAWPKVKETVSEARKTKLSLKVSEAHAFLATCKILRVHHFSFLRSLPSCLISILQVRFSYLWKIQPSQRLLWLDLKLYHRFLKVVRRFYPKFSA